MNGVSEDVLVLTWSMTDVSKGDDVCQTNPLARVTKNLFSGSGRPFKRLNKCFFRDQLGCVRWFGIFVHSAGDRVLFFPGYSKQHDHLIGFRDQSPWKNVKIDIDHITLEKNLLSWHFTNSGSTEHVGKIFTKDLSNGARHWFSLSVSSQNDLREVKENTIVNAPVPTNDIDRRIAVFKASREEAAFNILSVHNENFLHSATHFFHFTVLVGTPGFKAPDDLVLGLPFQDPVFGGAQSVAKQIPIRIFRIELSEKIELLVVTSVHEGKLLKEFVFSGS